MYFRRFVNWNIAQGCPLTWVIACEPATYPHPRTREPMMCAPNWELEWLNRFDPKTNSLLANEETNEEFYLAFKQKAPQQVLEGNFKIHDLSHLNQDNFEEEQDDDERDDRDN